MNGSPSSSANATAPPQRMAARQRKTVTVVPDRLESLARCQIVFADDARVAALLRVDQGQCQVVALADVLLEQDGHAIGAQ